MTDLEKALSDARAAWDKMTPVERDAMLAQQRRSYAVSEMGFGTDADEAAYRDAISSGDAERIAECERQAQERMRNAERMMGNDRP